MCTYSCKNAYMQKTSSKKKIKKKKDSSPVKYPILPDDFKFFQSLWEFIVPCIPQVQTT